MHNASNRTHLDKAGSVLKQHMRATRHHLSRHPWRKAGPRRAHSGRREAARERGNRNRKAEKKMKRKIKEGGRRKTRFPPWNASRKGGRRGRTTVYSREILPTDQWNSRAAQSGKIPRKGLKTSFQQSLRRCETWGRRDPPASTGWAGRAARCPPEQHTGE